MNKFASPTKLRNGNWGARVQGTVQEGDSITIETKAGKRWDAIVSKVVWSGNGVSICATESRPATKYRSASALYCGYPCPVTRLKCCAANGPCHDCE